MKSYLDTKWERLRKRLFGTLCIQVDASLSNSGGKGVKIIEYKWNFGNGSPEKVSNDPTISHKYPISGDYVITLTVVNSCGKSLMCSQKVSVHHKTLKVLLRGWFKWFFTGLICHAIYHWIIENLEKLLLKFGLKKSDLKSDFRYKSI